jgi:hypothetical protein
MNNAILLPFMLVVVVLLVVTIPNLPVFFNYKLNIDIIYMSLIVLTLVGFFAVAFRGKL